eukprot:1160744-Pelagomonas_calceolata.AAC.16
MDKSGRGARASQRTADSTAKEDEKKCNAIGTFPYNACERPSPTLLILMPHPPDSVPHILDELMSYTAHTNQLKRLSNTHGHT